MPSGQMQLADQLAALIEQYRAVGQFAQLRTALQAVARSATPDALVIAAESFREDPHAAAPLYEVIVETQPQNARALVVLANAYWLLGTGPEAVEELATRAMTIEPANRGAWHLWALAESDPRQRTNRWRQVSERFAEDDLALANLADNAAAVAGAEHDYEMLDLAVAAYEELLARAPGSAQRAAVETALQSLRGWRF